MDDGKEDTVVGAGDGQVVYAQCRQKYGAVELRAFER